MSTKSAEIMQYLEHYDLKNITDIEARIKTLTNLKSYATIIHDKDVREDGSPKPPHFHAIVTFSNATKYPTIAKAMKLPDQFVNKIQSSVKTAQFYLVHRNDPDKYQYDTSEVVANFDYVEFLDGIKPRTNRESIAERIASGEIKHYNLHRFISVVDYAKDKAFYNNAFEYRRSLLRGLDRNMKCIFITGHGGSGKTTFAKYLATSKGYETYISSGGKNPLDNYEGQECIILDDTRSSTWVLSDFLKLTDNHTDSLVGCRYYNKSIAECKLLIVTSVKSLDEFYEHATKEDNEPKIQLLRRFEVVARVTPETVYYSAYDPEKERHIYAMSMANPCHLMYDKSSALDFLKDICNTFKVEVPDKDLEKIFTEASAEFNNGDLKGDFKALAPDDDLPW